MIKNDKVLIQIFQSTKKNYHEAAKCLLMLLEDQDMAVPFLKKLIDLSFKSPICKYVFDVLKHVDIQEYSNLRTWLLSLYFEYIGEEYVYMTLIGMLMECSQMQPPPTPVQSIALNQISQQNKTDKTKNLEMFFIVSKIALDNILLSANLAPL